MEGLAAAEHVIAQVAGGRGAGDGFEQHRLGVRVFRTQVDVAARSSHREAGDGHALDQHIGVVFHHHAVGEGARVAFVGVADDVLLRSRAAKHGAPLDAGGECRAATAAQAGFGDLGDYRLGRHAEGALEATVAVVGDVILQRQRVGDADAGEGQALLALEIFDFLGQAVAQRMCLALVETGIEQAGNIACLDRAIGDTTGRRGDLDQRL